MVCRMEQDDHDILREQFEFLLEHREQSRHAEDCGFCRRYIEVRHALMEIFTEASTRTPVTQMSHSSEVRGS